MPDYDFPCSTTFRSSMIHGYKKREEDLYGTAETAMAAAERHARRGDSVCAELCLNIVNTFRAVTKQELKRINRILAESKGAK